MDYRYAFTYHHGETMEETLRCISYDKYENPNEVQGFHEPVEVNGTVEVRKLEYLNIDRFVSKTEIIYFYLL